MTRVQLPPGCYGFSGDGGRTKILAERGPGSYAIVDDGQLKKLKSQDYAQAGLVDATAERFFSTRTGDGRWCPDCTRMWNRWNQVCVKCGRETVPETEIARRPVTMDDYIP